MNMAVVHDKSAVQFDKLVEDQTVDRWITRGTTVRITIVQTLICGDSFKAYSIIV